MEAHYMVLGLLYLDEPEDCGRRFAEGSCNYGKRFALLARETHFFTAPG